MCVWGGGKGLGGRRVSELIVTFSSGVSRSVPICTLAKTGTYLGLYHPRVRSLPITRLVEISRVDWDTLVPVI